MISETTIVKVIKELEVTDLAGEKVMIDFESGNYLLIKGSGNDIWDIITAGEVTVGAIIDKLLEEYDVDRETCTASVNDFIGKLEGYKFVELVD